MAEGTSGAEVANAIPIAPQPANSILVIWLSTRRDRQTLWGDLNSFEVDYTSFGAVANIGRRWMLTDSLNITGRLGAGFAERSYSTDSDLPGADEAVTLTEDLVSFFPVTLDGEVSLGWTF